MARVGTYINFPHNTEDVFNYYKSIFGREFIRTGIAQFSDIHEAEGASKIADEDKNLVIHKELPIFGGHLLMGTDTPESMGIKVNFGNNMHITLEPDAKVETKCLFDALSEGGKITIGLKDMFGG
jgi:PhnB protein